MIPAARPSIRQQNALLTALRGGEPFGIDDALTVAALFRRYECGGWLHVRRRLPGAMPLPEPWRTAAAAAHQKTLVDSLAALGVGREVVSLFTAAGIPVLVLKGAAYLGTLYTDPGERALTDVDLLVRPGDTARAAEILADAGFAVIETSDSPDVAEHRRFEMGRPDPTATSVELHWAVGSGGRMRFDQGALWKRAHPTLLQDVACRTLDPCDALLYHVGHAREHYFGPTLKWALDLRALFELARPDPDRLLEAARAAGVATALHLAIVQIESLFPGSTPAGLATRSAPPALQRALLARARLAEPLEFFPWSSGERRRTLLRPLLFDSAGDALAVTFSVLGRPWRRRHAPPPDRPWEAAGGRGLGPETPSSVD